MAKDVKVYGVYNIDTQKKVKTFEEFERKGVIEWYESLGYEVSEDIDRDLAITKDFE